MTKKVLGNLVFISLLILVMQLLLGANNSFISDSLVKAIQIDSIQKNSYSSDKIFYPGEEYDPEFRLHPLNEGFIFKSKDRFIGQYPIMFTYLFSLIPIKLQNLPFTNPFLILSLLVLIFYLKKEGSITLRSAWVLIFLTPLIGLVFDLSEYPLFLFLTGSGFFSIYQFWKIKNSVYLILGAFLLGLSIWLRLESIIFAGSIFLFTLYYFYSEKTSLKTYTIIGLGGLVFLIPVIGFLVFNYSLYDHPLGPRYSLNVSTTSLSVLDRVRMLLTIVFTYPRSGVPSLGLFFFSPIFLYILVKSIWNWKNTDSIEKSLVGISIAYLLLTGLSAPNDGITLTARYAVLAVFPLTILLSNEWKRTKFTIWQGAMLSWSAILLILILAIFKYTVKEVEKYNTYLGSLDSEIFITTDDILSSSFGLKNTTLQLFAVRREGNIQYTRPILEDESIKKIGVIGYSEDFKGYPEKDQLTKELQLYVAILKHVESFHFLCTPVESKSIPLQVQICTR